MSRASTARSPARGPAPKSCHPRTLACAPSRSRQEAVVLGDDGAVAVADVQLRHGPAHALLHHFLAGQNRSQSLPDALRQRKVQVLAQRDPVQMVRQAEHVPPGLVTLGYGNCREGLPGIRPFNTSPSFQPRL